MVHTLQFVFSDGLGRQVAAVGGQGILEASRAAGIHPLVDCEAGTCGTCQARLCGGEVAMDPFDDHLLSAAELREGAILLCRARAMGPAVIELPYASADASLPPTAEDIGAEVVGAERVARETLRLILRTALPLHFLAGQYVHIAPEPGFARSFSMATPPGGHELEFFIAEREGGRFARWLAGAGRGDSVAIGAARGTFFLREDARPIVMVAGGTGLAPFLSMLRQLASVGGDPQQRRIDLLVGARSDEHLFGHELLHQLQARLPGLRIRHACDSVGAGTGWRTGRVTGLLEETDLAGAMLYACGPPAMVEAAREAARRKGLPATRFLAEKFTG